MGQPGEQVDDATKFSDGHCVHCGLELNKFSIANHDVWCKHYYNEKNEHLVTEDPTNSGGGEKVKSQLAGGGKQLPSDIVARVVTLGPGQCETVYFRSSSSVDERPKTRNLPYSSLQKTGYKIPSNYVKEPSDGYKQCGKCKKNLAGDSMKAHMKNCNAVSKISTKGVNFPSSKAPIKDGKRSMPPPQQQQQNSKDDLKQPFVVCYICGREFGSLSIAIHEPQCLKKFRIANSKLPINLRKPLPKKSLQKSGIAGVGLDGGRGGGTAAGTSVFASRRVPPLQQHQQQHSFQAKDIYKSPFVVCYICGREFGSLSIAIHEPQCLKKFNIQNRKLPISQRKPLPKKPPQESEITYVSSREILPDRGETSVEMSDIMSHKVQGYFDECYSKFEEDFVPCNKCGRTFAPDRHKIHEPNCRAKPIN